MRKVVIRQIDKISLISLKSLINKWQFKPNYYYDFVDNKKLTENLMEQFLGKIKQKNIFSADINGIPAWIAVFQKLNWDSAQFNLSMGKIEFIIHEPLFEYKNNDVMLAGKKLVLSVLNRFRDSLVRHISCKVDTKDLPTIGILEANNFKLVDTVVTYSINLLDFNEDGRKNNFLVCPIKKDDIDKMRELAKTAFGDKKYILTRFHNDPYLSFEGANKMYEEWFMNSVRKEIADEVFVAKSKEQPIGFITCKHAQPDESFILKIKIGKVDLNAVSYDYRGKGVYTAMVIKALEWFKENKTDFVEIKTQISTNAVQRVWQKLGAKLVSSQYTFHKYLKKGER